MSNVPNFPVRPVAFRSRSGRVHRLCLLLLLGSAAACAAKPAPVMVPPELAEIVTWLRAHPPAANVLTLTETGAAAVRQAAHTPVVDGQGQLGLLGRDAKALLQTMADKRLDYLLTTEPDLHDAPALTKDKAVLVPSVLQHLISLYGTGTRDPACVDGLQLVATSSAIRNVGGRHLPAAMLFHRVPGARLQLHKLVPGIPVRVETTRTFAGQVFVFDCQTRADATGNLDMRFPYPSLPTAPVRMWTAVSKSGDPIAISAEAVDKGQIVDLSL